MRIKDCKSGNSLVNAYKKCPEFDSRDIMTLVGDFLLAGIETSGNTMAFLLDELSRNAKVQENLHASIADYDDFNELALKKFKFGKAIIQENFRLHPISVGIGRKLSTSIELSGYEIPVGTNVVTQNQVSCKLENYCPHKPEEFLPERYLTKENRLDPFVSLPFGFGPRMCIGRRMAELTMQALLFNLAKNFNFESKNNSTVDCESLLINQPDAPISLKLHLN